MQNRTSPSDAARVQNTSSRDLAVAAIKEALEMIGEADRELDPPRIRQNEKRDRADARVTKLIGNWQPARIAPRMLLGLLALVCIGVAVMAWQSNGGKAASEPVVTSSLPTKAPPSTLHVAAAMQAEPQESRAQALPQSAPSGPAAAPMPAELGHQIQEMTRELANVEQGIGQLKAEQSQIAGESAGLAELLKQTRELARHSTELIENLNATQAQIAREVSNLTDQLKANQNLMMTLAGQLKDNQEQIARLAASEQKQRPRPLASSPVANVSSPPVANLVRRAAPKPPTSPAAGAQVRDPGHPQAGQ